MRLQNAEVDFTGQTLFVGIDIGQKSWKVCVILGDRDLGVTSHDPDGAIVGKNLHSHFPGANYSCAYEAGY